MNTAAIELPEPRTPLYPLIQQRVAEAARPIVERLQAWKMMGSETGLNTTNFHGKPVRYRDIRFDGSPRTVFWADFFEPFILDVARQSLEWVIDCCRSRHLDPGEYLAETTTLLGVLIAQAYEDMARTDRVLRGAGYPNSVRAIEVSHKVEAMKKRVDELVVALTHSGSAAPSAAPSEVVQLRPGLWGMSIDLKALWRRWFKRAI